MKTKILAALKRRMIKMMRENNNVLDFFADCCTEAMLNENDRKNFDDEIASECAEQLKAMIYNP